VAGWVIVAWFASRPWHGPSNREHAIARCRAAHRVPTGADSRLIDISSESRSWKTSRSGTRERVQAGPDRTDRCVVDLLDADACDVAREDINLTSLGSVASDVDVDRSDTVTRYGCEWFAAAQGKLCFVITMSTYISVQSTGRTRSSSVYRCHPSSSICIFLITNHQPLFQICITSPVESAPFFIPSTSFCSLSSWFTSSCTYHLITVTTFALITYHSLNLSLQT